MYRGLSPAFAALLRCHKDGRELRLLDQEQVGQRIERGKLRCSSCDVTYSLEAGIARILDPGTLDGESAHELDVRDQQAARDLDWELSDWNQMDIESTIRASEPLRGASVLELGAGAGRFTVRMVERGAKVLAVDFSLRSLETVATRVNEASPLGLVHADCTKLEVVPDSFDLVASTLMSNLPTERHRANVLRLAASALKQGGKFVFSTHHYDIVSRLRGEPRAGHYPKSGIFRYLFDRRSIAAELSPHFAHFECRPIQIPVPLTGRIGMRVAASRLAERIPLVKQFGALLLITAYKGRPRAGSRTAQAPHLAR